MDAKVPLQEVHVSRPKLRQPVRPKFLVVGVCIILIFLALLQSPSRFWYYRQSCHDQRLQYAGEKIRWDACGDIKGHPLECSSISVPLDQFDSVNSGNRSFSIPLIRLRGKNATQNLLLNPGGPGGSGIEFMYRRGEQLNTIVGEGFHLLSFDPRGVNGSRPLATCYPDKETRRNLSPVRDTRVVEDSAEAYAWSSNYGKACSDTMGEHGWYVNTPQTAADMNSILDAVGQDDMIYWGFSYGTLLGQTYAGLFPGRSKRVIIDGVANQFDWYENLFDAESLEDTEQVFEGFLHECIKAGKNCPLQALGLSKDELWHKIMSLADGLDEEPLNVYVNNSVYGLLTYEDIVYKAIFPALYKPANWYSLADRLAKLLQGNATEALLSYGQSEPWDLVGDSNSFVQLNDGLSGPKFWPHNRKDILKMLVPFMNQSLFSPTEYGGYYQKQHWSIPKTHHYIPSLGVKTAHPLLILSTTYDPVCPLISAYSAHKAFEGSKIVEVEGYGHCSISMPSECLAKHVRGFLYNGTLPQNHTKCEVDGSYFVKPEEDGKFVPLKHFADPLGQQLHLAQVEIARDPSWPRW
jgi:pimeloyl-ACP methyl ester carboxylesterase